MRGRDPWKPGSSRQVSRYEDNDNGDNDEEEEEDEEDDEEEEIPPPSRRAGLRSPARGPKLRGKRGAEDVAKSVESLESLKDAASDDTSDAEDEVFCSSNMT